MFQVEEGGQVTLQCGVKHLGNMVLMWKQVGRRRRQSPDDMTLCCPQGPRVLTAGSMVVRRDRRLRLEGNNLVISELEAADR